MDSSILGWGLDLIKSVQKAASPVLTTVMTGITWLGYGSVYVAAIAVILWCIDERKGVRIGILVLLSGFINAGLKDLFALPRPFEVDPSVRLGYESGYGLPSGHAQGSVVFWGAVAAWVRKPWGVVVAVILPLVIGFTRIYLGVHFPLDVVAGWAIGIVILLLYTTFADRLERALDRTDIRIRILAATAVAGIMILLHRADVSIPGGFFGLCAGSAFLEKNFRYDAGGTVSRKVARLAIGFAVIALISLGLAAISPKEGMENYDLFRFARYGLIGAWVSLGAPWVFLKLNLARESAVTEQIE